MGMVKNEHGHSGLRTLKLTARSKTQKSPKPWKSRKTQLGKEITNSVNNNKERQTQK